MHTSVTPMKIPPGIEAYLPMVKCVAASMIGRLPPCVELDDMVQASALGLAQAMERYEPGHNAKFETFASQRVRGAMLDELRGTDWVPRAVRKNERAIAAAVQKLEQKLQRTPTKPEVADHLQVQLHDYHDMLTDSQSAKLVYYHDYESPNGECAYVDRHAAVDESADPAAKLEHRRSLEALIAGIDNLPAREQDVMQMYYEQDNTFSEIAAVLGLTESRVWQLHSKAVARLKFKMKDW
ncbi:RNA polymerase sigma factor FliA [soil metagenome]